MMVSSFSATLRQQRQREREKETGGKEGRKREPNRVSEYAFTLQQLYLSTFVGGTSFLLECPVPFVAHLLQFSNELNLHFHPTIHVSAQTIFFLFLSLSLFCSHTLDTLHQLLSRHITAFFPRIRDAHAAVLRVQHRKWMRFFALLITAVCDIAPLWRYFQLLM